MQCNSVSDRDVRNASDRVRDYVYSEIERMAGKPHVRLPSARRLAQTLSVSPRTVHTVYRDLEGMGLVTARVGSGTYLRKRELGMVAKQEYRVAILVPAMRGDDSQRDARDDWHHLIFAGIMQAAAQQSPPMLIQPIETVGEAPLAPVAMEESMAGFDGFLMFPFIDRENRYRMREILEQAHKPVVDLNPGREMATANFVTSDYFGATRRLGEAWLATGRRRVLLLSSGPLSRSVSTTLRYLGLAAGLQPALGGSVALEVLETDGPSETAGFRAMRGRLAAGAPPDAVCAAGDSIALGALRAALEHGLRCPDDISVVGGTGCDLSGTSWPHFTRMKQPLMAIGSELVRMLGERLARDCESLPGRVLPTDIVGGQTTRPEENVLLQIACKTIKEPL